jgi:DNA-binding NarL/FixJ family response regulator
VPKVAEPEQLLQAQTQLSKREAEVAWLATCGCTDKEIAQRLRLSFATVRFHMANAFRKMHVENRAALASRVQAIVGQQRAELAGQQANPGVQDLCLLSV